MATKGEHEKPEAVDEHQPITKKVRLDVDAKVTEDVKKVTIDENADVRPEACVSKNAPTKQTEVAMPTADADTHPKQHSTEVPSAIEPTFTKSETEDTSAAAPSPSPSPTTAPTEEKVTKPNTTGSAYGGFAAFSGKSGFAGFTSSATSGGFGIKASSPGATFGDAATTKPLTGGFGSTSSGFGSGSATSNGFASFQSSSGASFASFASTTTSSDGFGKTTSSKDFTELHADVEKKTGSVVAALSEAELANGEENEQILVEKRAKLYKLVDKDYAEVGIGPLRVLSAKDTSPSEEKKPSVRIVMRRESYARGPGTKLLINARLSACLHCEKKAEKAMLLTVLEAAEPDEEKEFTPVTYLMRFGSPEEMEAVLARIQSHLPRPAADAASTS